jgi:hypothetical protein
VDWLRLHLRYSLGLGWQDAIRKTSEHVVIAVIVVLTGAGLAWLSTGQFGDALLLLLAWPAAFVVVYAYFFIRRLFRRNPLWQQLPDRIYTGDVGQVLELSMQRRNWVADNTDITCWMVDSAGHEIELTNGGYSIHGLAYNLWIGIGAGKYTVIWKARAQPSDPWRVCAYWRVVVPEPHVESPAARRAQLAVERIAPELARRLAPGNDDQYQVWLNYLSGHDKNAQRPADPHQD